MKVKTFNVTNLFFKNQCYLIYHKNKGILVDPAWECKTIQSFLLLHSIEVKAILLTHSHLDHTNLAGKISKDFDIPVFMSNEEINT